MEMHCLLDGQHSCRRGGLMPLQAWPVRDKVSIIAPSIIMLLLLPSLRVAADVCM